MAESTEVDRAKVDKVFVRFEQLVDELKDQGFSGDEIAEAIREFNDYYVGVDPESPGE